MRLRCAFVAFLLIYGCFIPFFAWTCPDRRRDSRPDQIHHRVIQPIVGLHIAISIPSTLSDR